MSDQEGWASALERWAIPEQILAQAPESPWGFPTELFRRRAEDAARRGAADATPTTLRALEALDDGGSVLDVGVGSGATSLPLATRAGRIVGVDQDTGMLTAFVEAATAAGVESAAVEGRWPDVAAAAPVCTIAVSGHVLYNVPDLLAFAAALDAHATRRVVLELTERHPLSWMRDLWGRFWDLERPDGPAADDAASLLTASGFRVQRDQRIDADRRGGGFARPEDAVALVRRRLCLPADRDREIADALGDLLRAHDGLWSSGPAEVAVVTLWWDVG
jgi:SAM-dependent methyltransferase